MENKLRQRAERLREALEKIEVVREKTESSFSSFSRRGSGIVTDMLPFLEAKDCHENLSNTLRKTEVLVDHFDRIAVAEKVISEGPSDNLKGFLAALDQLEKSTEFFNSHNISTAANESAIRAKSVRADATRKAETDFKKMLTDVSKPVDPTSLCDESAMVFKVPTLISPQDIPLLDNLVAKLVLFGRETRCIKIYRDARANALELSLNHLGVENIQSEDIETQIHEWIKLMLISVKSLFAGERDLCNQVLKRIEKSSLDRCFVEVTSSSLAKLLRFGEVVIKQIEKSPDKLFVLLNLYYAMLDLTSEMEEMLAIKPESIMLQPMVSLRDWLAETSIEIYLGFPELVAKKDSKPTANGGVHPFSSYIMEYLKGFLIYQDILNHLLVNFKPEDQEEYLQFAPSILKILQALKSKLEEISKQCTEPGQSDLFLMNNIRYMVTSVEEIEGAKEVPGEDWISEQRKTIELMADLYRKASWKKVLDSISKESFLLIPPAGSSHPILIDTEDEVKKKFKNFNAQYEEQLQKQRLWKVHDPEIRESLRLSVAETVVSAYRTFLEQFGCRLVKSKTKRKYRKYTPEEIEKMLHESLFAEGETSTSQSRE